MAATSKDESDDGVFLGFEEEDREAVAEWRQATILVKTVGTIRAFPASHITMLIFTVSKIKIRSSIAGMFQHCLGGRGGPKKGSERRTNVAHITMEACTVNSLLFCPKFDKCPEVL